MKARKKPVEIECVQWNGNNLQEIRGFVGEYLIENRYEGIDDANVLGTFLDNIQIYTLEGCHRCNIGDYIIKGVHGEFYPCSLISLKKLMK